MSTAWVPLAPCPVPRAGHDTARRCSPAWTGVIILDFWTNRVVRTGTLGPRSRTWETIDLGPQSSELRAFFSSPAAVRVSSVASPAVGGRPVLPSQTHAHPHTCAQTRTHKHTDPQAHGQPYSLTDGAYPCSRAEWPGSPLPPWVGSPVDADGTQVQDACRAHHDIQSDKDVAVNPAEFPLAHHLGTKHQNGWAAEGKTSLGP